MLELQTIYLFIYLFTNNWYCEWLLVSEKKNDISNELKWESIKKNSHQLCKNIVKNFVFIALLMLNIC